MYILLQLCGLCGVSDLHANVCKSHCSRPYYCATTLHSTWYIYSALLAYYNVYTYIEDKNYSRNDTSPPMAFVCICIYYVYCKLE